MVYEINKEIISVLKDWKVFNEMMGGFNSYDPEKDYNISDIYVDIDVDENGLVDRPVLMVQTEEFQYWSQPYGVADARRPEYYWERFSVPNKYIRELFDAIGIEYTDADINRLHQESTTRKRRERATRGV